MRLMDILHGSQLFPLSPGTLTSSTPNSSSCSTGDGTPCSFKRYRTRKVARTPSKQREETKPFDSLLDSFVETLQSRSTDRGDVKTTSLTSISLRSCNGHSGKTTHGIGPIKLEELFSDCETDERKGIHYRLVPIQPGLI